jgi:hypothetical protein
MRIPVAALKGNPWPEVRWSSEQKPVLVLDGTLHEIEKLAGPVSGRVGLVVGVDDASFSRLCPLLTVEALQLYEMRVADLGPLAHVGALRQLCIQWNTGLVDLARLESQPSLEALILVDTPGIRDLVPIAKLRNLKHLEFSGGWWKANTARSLAPIAELPVLEDLTLLNLRVESDGLRPLARCPSLRRLEVSNQFRTEDYAYLSVALPAVECRLFTAFVSLPTPIAGKDVMVVGSHKPILSSTSDRARLEKYESAFQRLRDEFARSVR